MHRYTHEKHTAPERGVSVVREGTCDNHKRLYPYGAHEEFVEKK